MNNLPEEKKMTLKEVAEITGASYRTIAGYAHKAGWTQNGKKTHLDEWQVTIILEAMRNKAENGVGEAAKLASVLQGVETFQSRMTIREVADILEVSTDTIYNSAKELFPDIFNTGKTTYFSEKQVTAIKLNLRKNSKVNSQPKTNLEKALLIKQALLYQQEIINSLQEENRNLAVAFGKEILDHRATKLLSEERAIGLEIYQRAVEEGGLMLSDRDDILANYKRR